MRAIEIKTKILKDIILKSGGKVRIFPTLNTGEELGYQYIFKDSSSVSYQYFPYTPSGFQHFDIDFNTDSLALEKLKYVVQLTMIYTSSYDGDSGLRELLFIVKGVDELGNYRDITYDKSICSFNYRKLFKPEEIYSSGTYLTENTDVSYYHVNIAESEGVLDFERVNDLWDLYGYIFMSDREFMTIYDGNIFYV